MQQISLTNGDYGVVLQVTLKDSSKLPINLTSCTVSIDLIKPDNTKVTRTATITSAVDGQVSYTLTAEDTDQVGNYSLYFIVNSASYKITAQKVINYYCKEIDGGVS